MRSLALFVLLCMAPLCSGAESLYIIVLQPVQAGQAPFDVATFGGTLEHRNGLRLAVRLPESTVGGVKSDERVRYVQKVVVGHVERDDRPARDHGRIGSQSDVAAESVGTIVRGPYTYDGTGNVWSIGPAPTPDERFTYDRIGRLSTAKIYSEASLHQQSFAYDAPGNLTNVTTNGVSVALPVQGNTNRLATSAGFTYNATGNMTGSPMSTSYSYDQLGMLQSDASTPYTNVYTPSDERLAVITTSANPRWRWTLRDLSNQRVRDFESFGPSGTEYFLWLEDSYHDGSRVIASQRDPAEGGWRHFHLDHLGTPRLTTNEEGRQISRHDYLPFGVELTSLRAERNRGFAREQVSRFTGHERDYLELTNADGHSVYLDHMHARMYNSNWGRFVSVDPVLGDPGVPQSWNRYSYALNNPINFTDPSGMKPCKMTLPDGTEVEGECIDVEAEADDVEEVDWEQATSDFFAGFGDSLTFGGTKVIREAISQSLFDTNTPVNPCSAAYALGEYTEIGLELAATGGSAGLRVAASQASRRAVRSAARAATRGASREAGQVIHHANPLFGHPGGASTLFPTGGLPASIHSGSWNLQALSHAEHMAAHRYMRQLERGASIAVNPGTTAARAGRNLAGQQQCGG